MDKEKLKEIFDELLNDYEGCSYACNNSMGNIDDQNDIEKDIEDYRRRFYEALNA